MTQRVVLVTGAARGIGAATTRLLADQGHQVLALDWCAGDNSGLPYAMGTRAQLDTVASAGNVVAHIADVCDPAAMADAVAVAVERWGRLDAVVAAAAVIVGGESQWETDLTTLDLMWDIDVQGVWNTAGVAIPAMLAGPEPSGCRFVAVASAAGSHGLFHLAGYNAAKHAVVGIVKGLAADLVGTGVTACAVSPGSTRTDMLTETARLYGLESVEDLAKHQLTGRLLEPEEVAETIAFCASTAGGVVNGTVVHADGGFAP